MSCGDDTVFYFRVQEEMEYMSQQYRNVRPFKVAL